MSATFGALPWIAGSDRAWMVSEWAGDYWYVIATIAVLVVFAVHVGQRGR